MTINADSSDPNRTHHAVTRYSQYGVKGHVERGFETLMRQAQVSITDCSPHVQAIGVFRDVIAALRACGQDPDSAWSTAKAHRDGA
jgi:hypothetical protein